MSEWDMVFLCIQCGCIDKRSHPGNYCPDCGKMARKRVTVQYHYAKPEAWWQNVWGAKKIESIELSEDFIKFQNLVDEYVERVYSSK